MSELSLNGFITFIKDTATAEPEREIDHTYWETCAVGDYALHAAVGRCYYGLLLDALRESAPDLLEELNFAERLGTNRTYGELLATIERKFPELLENTYDLTINR